MVVINFRVKSLKRMQSLIERKALNNRLMMRVMVRSRNLARWERNINTDEKLEGGSRSRHYVQRPTGYTSVPIVQYQDKESAVQRREW